jgi:hypothetical protein
MFNQGLVHGQFCTIVVHKIVTGPSPRRLSEARKIWPGERGTTVLAYGADAKDKRRPARTGASMLPGGVDLTSQNDPAFAFWTREEASGYTEISETDRWPQAGLVADGWNALAIPDYERIGVF